jgi:hypothetical protein
MKKKHVRTKTNQDSLDNIVTGMGLCVIYKTGFWIGCLDLLTPYSHHSRLQAIQRYRWTTHFTIHRNIRTRVLSLLATDSFQWPQTSISRTRPICRQQLTQMNSSSTELSQLLTAKTAPLELLVIQPRGGPHGKHRLLSIRIFLGVFIDPLPRDRSPIIARVGSHGGVFTESSQY